MARGEAARQRVADLRDLGEQRQAAALDAFREVGRVFHPKLEVVYRKLMTEDDQQMHSLGGDDPFELDSIELGALPIVCSFLARMRVEDLLERHLGEPDARCHLDPALAIGLLVRNLCVSHRPLYRLGEWAAPFDPALLGLMPEQVAALGDDQVGRALDRLFASDRATLLTELVLGVIAEFDVDCSQLHNDSTSITLHGAYRDADGYVSAGKATVTPAHGHNKDHRPDLKQLLWILTVSADGALPLVHRLEDGNLTDDQTHIATWEAPASWWGEPTFSMSPTASSPRPSRCSTSTAAAGAS